LLGECGDSRGVGVVSSAPSELSVRCQAAQGRILAAIDLAQHGTVHAMRAYAAVTALWKPGVLV
jgi:hypothetical protein